jgi:nucleoprotein TPR
MEHTKLLEQVEQLNLLRESNASLRQEGAASAKALAEAKRQGAAAAAALEPLQVSVEIRL